MKYQVTLKTKAIAYAIVEVDADSPEAAEEAATDKAVELTTSEWTISDAGCWESEGLAAVSVAADGNIIKWQDAKHLYGACGEIV